MVGRLSSAAVLATCVSGLRRGVTKKQGTKTLAGVSLMYADDGAIADQWMVVFADKAPDAALGAFCAQAGCSKVGHPEEGGVPFAVVKATEQQLETSIAAHAAGIQYIEQDAIAEDFPVSEEEEATEATTASRPWGLDAIGQPNSRSKGQGVNVYVLDSGVRVTHSDFGGRAIPFYDAARSNPVCEQSDTRCAGDNRGHGTHVAGSVGAATYGVAPASTIMAMNRGRSLSDGFGSIDWLVQNRKRPAVLQMSWGTGTMYQAAVASVDAAVAAGITVTVASGNSRQDACGWTFAGVSSAIAVASTDSTSSRSSFSNFGPCIDIMAPGSSILSTDYSGDTRTSVKSGTSMAAPHVAGGAALILEQNPTMSPEQVLQQLQANARKDFISDSRSPKNFFLTVGSASAQSLSEVESAGTISLRLSDCGGSRHVAKLTDYSPKSVQTGATSTIRATGRLSEDVSGGRMNMVIKMTGFPWTTLASVSNHNICQSKSLDLRAVGVNAGRLVWQGLPCQMRAGGLTVPLSLTLSSSLPANLANVAVNINGTSSNGKPLFCASVTTFR